MLGEMRFPAMYTKHGPQDEPVALYLHWRAKWSLWISVASSATVQLLQDNWVQKQVITRLDCNGEEGELSFGKRACQIKLNIICSFVSAHSCQIEWLRAKTTQSKRHYQQHQKHIWFFDCWGVEMWIGPVGKGLERWLTREEACHANLKDCLQILEPTEKQRERGRQRQRDEKIMLQMTSVGRYPFEIC